MEQPPGAASNHREQVQPIPSQELLKIAAEETLAKLESLDGYEAYSDISKMYRSLGNHPLVVRRENPEALMHTLESHEPLSIQFVGNTPYANSVEWNPQADGPRGLDNAYLEGYGQKDGVVMVYGFEKPEGFYFEQHPESQQVFAGIDRLRVRSAAGFVPSENIRFVTVRIPLMAFPENRMTEEEKDLLWEYTNVEGVRKPPAFVYRGYLATKEAANPEFKMAA